jgi:hypothetical protein
LTDQISDATFLVVTGTMRSGTTLMGELLYARQPPAQRHPQLAFDNDRITTLRVLARLLRRHAPAGRLAAEDPEHEIPVLPALVARHFGVAGEGIGEAQALALLARRLRDEILGFAPSAEPPRVLGLKCTHLFREIDLLRRAFSRVIAVVMVRDPRDVLASSYGRLRARQPKRFINRVLVTALGYHYFLEARRADADLLAVRYESLVADPQAQLWRVLEAAGLDPARYDWAALAAGGVSSNSSWNAGAGAQMIAGSGISGGSVAAYRRHLSEFEIYAVETLLAPLMQRHGYEPVVPASRELRDRFAAGFLPELYQEAHDSGIAVRVLETRARELGLQGALRALPRSRWRPAAVARRAARAAGGLIRKYGKKRQPLPRP